MKLIDLTSWCLQQFDTFWKWSETTDRKLLGSAEACLEKFVKSLQVNVFLAVFSNLDTPGRGPRQFAKSTCKVNALMARKIANILDFVPIHGLNWTIWTRKPVSRHSSCSILEKKKTKLLHTDILIKMNDECINTIRTLYSYYILTYMYLLSNFD